LWYWCEGQRLGKLTSQEETLYEIAFRLGIPVYKMLEEMPYEELLGWTAYFQSRPPGWQEDQRTYLLMKAAGFKGKGSDIFPTLRLMEQTRSAKADAGHALPKGKFLNKMLEAVGGDESGWKPSWS